MRTVEAARRPGPGELEVCGLGIVAKRGERDRDGLGHVADAVRDEAWRRTLEALRSSGDERAAAAAALVESRLAFRRAFEAGAAQAADCAASDMACRREARRSAQAAGGLAAVPAIDALAAQAVHTSDPLVYGLAVEACARDEGAARAARWCQLVSAEQGARLDPDNAAAWLEVAAAANRRKDAAAEAEAIYRASIASRSDLQRAAVARLVDDGLPEGLDEAGRSAITVEAWQVQSQAGRRGLEAAARHCSGDALADANRRQSCETLAHVLLEVSGTWREAGVGLRIGERLGWPPESLQAARDEQKAQAEASARYLEEGGAASCEALQRRRAWARQVEAEGERKAAHALPK